VRVQKPREIAARLLQQRGEGADYIENLLSDGLSSLAPGGRAPRQELVSGTGVSPVCQGLSPVDRALCQELVYGVVRWRATLDWLIARKTQNRSQPPRLQNLLRLGLYQIFWLDRIPYHAAVNETVALARDSGLVSRSGFVNAVLRGYLRELEPTRQLLAELKSAQPGLGYSHPEWLAVRWQQRWGPEKAAQLMAWNNTPPKTFARLNTLKTDPSKLLAQWRRERVEFEPVHHAWIEDKMVFELNSHPPLTTLPSFQQGQFYVQDPSTLLAVRSLQPQPGQTILDLCAAPGGKLTYIAQLMQNHGNVIAHDVTPDRLKLIQENCARLGVTCAETVFPSTLNSQLSTLFDRILIDAPCSNTGVLRRRVDLRWRIRPEELTRLSALQLQLMHQAAPLLKPGGVLVYSTCSLEPEENEEVAREFLTTHGDFKLLQSHQLLPFVDGTDGVYVAQIKRV
jgi:16S rRNA (cytosine967-C5)-methyltransferase